MLSRGLCWLGLVLLLATPVVAAPARTSWGHPDLQGLWTNASLTPLERSPGLPLEPDEAAAAAFEKGHSGSPAPRDAVGHDQSEWWEMGGRLARIDGKPRASWIVDPSDGKIPYSAAGLAALQAQRAALLANYDHPEVRPPAERCLIGLGGTSGPPMLNAGYNNHIQILQTREHVVLVAEMNHDARIVALTPQPPAPGHSWTGHSVGRWDGPTLVVETTAFHPQLVWRLPAPLVMSPQARVTERFTRISPREIRYLFEVSDPAYLTRPWKAEMPLVAAKGPMFEVACHEGNYSLEGILAGARQKETAAR